MSNEIVKYSNQFNNQALRKFTAIDLDMLMAIATKVRDKGTEEVSFTFDELRKKAHLKKNLTDEQMAKEILQVNQRLLALNFMLQDGSWTIQFALFSDFETSAEQATLKVAVNKKFAFLLNDLTSNFTRFELAEFADLRSTYAKEFYRRARQYRSTGVWAVSLSDFRRLLDVPKSYSISHLNEKVLHPIEDELGDRIHLRIERKYAKRGSGRGRSRLVGFVFHFNFSRHISSDGHQVIEGKVGLTRAQTRRRNKIAREWQEEHEADCSASLAEIAKYAREHTEVSEENLPKEFARVFSR